MISTEISSGNTKKISPNINISKFNKLVAKLDSQAK
jgi:hypothetical protein